MAFLAQQILWGALLPALLTLVVLMAVNWRTWRVGGVSLHWGTPVALAAGYLFAHWRIVGLPLAFPPNDSTEWLFVVAVAAALWGIVEQFAGGRFLLRGAGRLVFTSAIAWLVLHPLMANLWQESVGYLWWGGLTLGWWLWWSFQARLGERVPGLLVPLVLSAVAGGGGFVLLWSNSSSLSQLSGAVSAVAGTLVPVLLWRRDMAVGAGSVAFVAGVLGLIWLNAIAFVPVPVGRIVGLVIASWTPVLALLPALKRRGWWVPVAVCFLVTALILIGIMLPTYRAYVASAQTYGY